VFEVTPERFGEMVDDALAAIPPDLAKRMDNVAIFVEDVVERRAGGGRLLGLYEGIPLTKRSSGYGNNVVMPDRITLYRTTICSICSSEAEVAEQVRTTLIHEVAHHFGIDDPRLRQLGW
jgi:predicted Zn-dependent protease with MMP-like domain